MFNQLFLYSDQHAFWNFIENKNDQNSIMKSDKNSEAVRWILFLVTFLKSMASTDQNEP